MRIAKLSNNEALLQLEPAQMQDFLNHWHNQGVTIENADDVINENDDDDEDAEEEDDDWDDEDESEMHQLSDNFAQRTFETIDQPDGLNYGQDLAGGSPNYLGATGGRLAINQSVDDDLLPLPTMNMNWDEENGCTCGASQPQAVANDDDMLAPTPSLFTPPCTCQGKAPTANVSSGAMDDDILLTPM